MSKTFQSDCPKTAENRYLDCSLVRIIENCSCNTKYTYREVLQYLGRLKFEKGLGEIR